ncbi:hypothetical protein [Methylobacter sp. S3L5C]|uniref:hypothetical protein n=1 Tax=Methylobacter sp. S3L5C TaxID=2839024 RepID=UPI001FADDB60|nr:hypothetical protein [Methylobacter sp. S3L5C]UOA07422.1 hypothetical protein KKZ03_14220 [Methylobacter sp. S3L5C]
MCSLTALIKNHAYAKTRTIRSGDGIHLQDGAGLILSGVVAVSESGADYIINMVTSGGFIRTSPTTNIYQAVNDCRITFVPRRCLQGVDSALVQVMVKENQALTQALIRVISQTLVDKVKFAIDMMVSLGLIRATNGTPEIIRGQFDIGIVTLLARLTSSRLESTSRVLKQLRLESV